MDSGKGAWDIQYVDDGSWCFFFRVVWEIFWVLWNAKDDVLLLFGDNSCFGDYFNDQDQIKGIGFHGLLSCDELRVVIICKPNNHIQNVISTCCPCQRRMPSKEDLVHLIHLMPQGECSINKLIN